ncbi:MAG: Gfo/Idh/MocA family oxidoreductase [Bryobacterales bacterium]|nr:Gfo/Idh/MocA family oxidoreductase [Bryobacterales bacterium]
MQSLPSFPRRTFIKAATAAIATSQFPILGANDRVSVGVVGLGGRGTDHLHYYSTLDGECRIAAVCDVNQAARERAVALVRKLKNYAPTEFTDMRKLFESKEIDAVSLPLPNHWHALATIWACQAGKDVYVEKPASHNLFESRQMVAAARKYKRMVQVGSQSRSITHKIHAMQLLREGIIGQIYHARGLCFRRRFSIGHTPDEPVPAGIDWDLFLGPAQLKPYSHNKYAYNWHWFWDTGNGDIGNQGVHEMDICLWGLPQSGWPVSVASTGGKFVWKDDQETPNTQQSSFNFGDTQMTFDVRNLPTAPEGLAPMRDRSFVGNIFYGEFGMMTVVPEGFQVYQSTLKNAKLELAGAPNSNRGEKFEKIMDEKAAEEDEEATIPHMKNFLEAVRSRDSTSLHAEIAIGARAASFCHLANLSYRTGKELRISQTSGKFINDEVADALYSRDYRAPFVVPDVV